MLALVAAVGYGVSDFVGGVASRRVAALRVVIVSYPFSLVIVLIVAPFVGGQISLVPILWGLASGVAGGLAVWWFYLALASGPMAVVSPLTAVLVAGIPVVAGFAIGERPGALAFVGIALALIAVLLVSKESPDDTTGEVAGGREMKFTPTVAWLTVGSGVTFALAFICLHQIGDGSGLWPLAASRASATAVVWCVALASGHFALPHGSVLKLAAFVGILDVVANAALLYAYQGGLLSLVSVIASLYPAATVLLAMVMLGERVGRLQQVGMVVALGAVGLIALG
ncbi:EamA/RhaT family transporter [Rhodococcus sp. RS1C4]|uniref:DMT family transporter n=1 Tax=Nocardiaceae TaxID=85025 RepID=UPI0009B91603|nr:MULTISPECIES: DMT family transporter [Rhodococcus]OZC44019.1 EamA/RhaT family transporter [Rhodococcus sp. RS1C4]OZC62318.1 EamA/RhaT family transporter [Rhodococcus sp. 06-621-2]OZC79824.1 EamA/RhaT family transporter [Rhodococcus sp. 06-418-1B]OZD19272.1 EamA/RhaT family transporter [Rhodococcus sp. 06-156-3C]OZD21606.1 EamA/RhaT family transporter [Rhodococcus sp. 06-156-4C]